MTTPNDPALLAGVAILLAACGDASPKAGPPVRPPPPVTVTAVVRESVPIVMPFSGTVKAVKEIDVIPRVGGFIEKRSFVEGSEVQQGDELYLIDPRTYLATLEGARAQLQRDQAALALHEAELKRYTQAGATGAVSREQVDQARAQRDEAAASAELDQANIEKATLDLSFARITAPFAGRVDQTRINVGELVSAHQSVLTTLTQMDPIYVIFNMSRADVFQVQQRIEEGVAAARLSDFTAHVTLPDGKEFAHPGTLDFVSAEIDPSTDTMTARAVFPNPVRGSYRELIPGQYVPLRLIVGSQDALLIPATAVIQTQAGSQVYVVGSDQTVALRRVTLGATSGSRRIVRDGLKVGETVIVEGLQKARPGHKVAPRPAQAGTPAAG